MHTIVEGENTPGAYTHTDTQMLPIIIGGSKDNPMELDYVRVWDGGGDDHCPEKIVRQEMLPTDFLHAFTEDVEGEPIITVNADNYMYILSGEKEWQKMSVATQKIVNGALELKGQVAYLELLKQAKALQKDLE